MAQQERVELVADFPGRGSVRGPHGGVACDNPLAAAAGLAALREGGSAADACIAMAAAMVVVQPQYSHLGGDAFAVCWDQPARQVLALNSSGPAPSGADPAVYRDMGGIPLDGPLAVTVPGCVDGWWQLHQRFGRLPFKHLLQPAIEIARDGFPASRGLARAVRAGQHRIYPADYARQVFGRVAGDGGQPVKQPALARTLAAIADGGASAFYEGEVAQACVRALNGRGGKFTMEDWRAPARWETPLSVPFAGVRVYTQPPPSRGLVLMLALQAYERATGERSPAAAFAATQHGFGVVNREAGDPDFTGFDAASLLTRRATATTAAGGSDGDTTYMLAIDGGGNAVSFIQSVFAQWGSGVFVPETGVLMNNRMRGFVLEPGHPNELAPGKRPMHTLHSYLATVGRGDDDLLAGGPAENAESLVIVGGTPGADRQPQTNLQVLEGLVRERLDPQDALDRARWSTSPGDPDAVEIETRPGDTLGPTFAAAGLRVIDEAGWHGKFGRAFAAVIGETGVAIGADLRGEGAALVL
jgi:gamma-glutamyltranspeptidase/glutathione hydrolase